MGDTLGLEEPQNHSRRWILAMLQAEVALELDSFGKGVVQLVLGEALQNIGHRWQTDRGAVSASASAATGFQGQRRLCVCIVWHGCSALSKQECRSPVATHVESAAGIH